MAGDDDAQAMLSDLDPDQRAAVTSTSPMLCILAGAGSGKTRVLTRRIAYRAAIGSLDPRHTLALTFTSRAAGELRGRLDGFGHRDLPTTGTFHAVAYAQLRTWWATNNRAEPALLDHKTRMISRLLPSRFPLRPATVAAEIEWAQSRMIGPDEFVDEVVRTQRASPVDPARVAQLYRDYVEEKRHRRVIDFDDLLAQCANALRNDADFARSQHWRFRHLFVDEYQDVNPLQHELLEAWRGDRPDLCVVGDPNQAIYRWNGADAGYLSNFAATHPDATVITLRTNHRSSPPVVAAAGRVLASALDGTPGRVVAQAVADPKAHCVAPTVTACIDGEAEAVTIARAIRAAHRPGQHWARQAVLVRTNAQATVLSELFGRAGIPNRVKGGHPLLEYPAVRDALVNAGRARVSLQSWVADLTIATQNATVDDNAVSDPDLAERVGALEQLAGYARQLLADQPRVQASALPGWVTATVRSDEGAAALADAVTIVSFHAAKGLEWPIVHLAGLEEGYVPSSFARSDEALAEEQRLLYVAITRAESQLHVTWARHRSFGPKTVERRPTRWLDAIVERAEPNTVPRSARRSVTSAEPNNGGSGSGTAQRDTRGEPTDRDPALQAMSERQVLFAALDKWRCQVARAADVPSAVVLPDTVVKHLVDGQPTTLDELAGIDGLGIIKAARYGDDILEVMRRAISGEATTVAQR